MFEEHYDCFSGFRERFQSSGKSLWLNDGQTGRHCVLLLVLKGQSKIMISFLDLTSRYLTGAPPLPAGLIKGFQLSAARRTSAAPCDASIQHFSQGELTPPPLFISFTPLSFLLTLPKPPAARPNPGCAGERPK